MKKMITMLLTLILSGVMLIGCAGGAGPSSKDNINTGSDSNAKAEGAADGDVFPEKFKIGYIALSTTGSFFGNAYRLVNSICDVTGSELITDIGAISPEDQISSLQNVISAGADAVVFINFTEDCLPKIAALCEQNQVYWGQFARDVADEEIASYLSDCEYYVGRCYNDETYIAREALKSFQESNITKVAIVGPATGESSTDLRDSYFQEHAGEYGIEVIADVRDLVDATSAMDAVSNIVASHSDVEGIYCISGSDSRGEGCINALTTLGMNGKIKVVMSDFFDGMDKYFEDGTVISAFGGSYPDSLFLAAIIMNQLSGTPLSENGEALALELPYIKVTSADELNEYYEYCEPEDGSIYDKEEIKKLIGSFNQELNLDYFKNVMSSYSLDDVKERHAK